MDELSQDLFKNSRPSLTEKMNDGFHDENNFKSMYRHKKILTQVLQILKSFDSKKM